MDNFEIYNKGRTVPKEALRTITAGRLKGKSDINPMWRIKKLTELFGPCGFGWYPTIIKEALHEGANGEIIAQVDIELRVKVDGEWSAPIPGTGGAMFVENETKGPHTSDEAFKMAYTDALSVCCKMLGIAADVYFEADKTKYTAKAEPAKAEPKMEPTTMPLSKDAPPAPICTRCGKPVQGFKVAGQIKTPQDVAKGCGGLCYDCWKYGGVNGG